MAPIEGEDKERKQTMQVDEHPRNFQTTMEQLNKLPPGSRKKELLFEGNVSGR